MFVFFGSGCRAADRLLIALKDEINGGGVRKFRGAAKAAVFDIELLRDGANLRLNDAGIEIGASAVENLRLRNGAGERVRGTLELGALVAIGIGNGEEHAAETGAPHLIIGREIRAAKKRLSVGEEKAGEKPAALPGDGAHGGLIA